MKLTSILDTPPREEIDYEAAIDRYFSEMERLVADMDERQVRIDRMQAETRSHVGQSEDSVK